MNDRNLESTLGIFAFLPGFGETSPLAGEGIDPNPRGRRHRFSDSNNLTGIDAVGSSMGARLVLELARRGGVLGAVVSLDPGGFWTDWQRHFLRLYLVFNPSGPSTTTCHAVNQKRCGSHTALCPVCRPSLEVAAQTHARRDA